MTAKYRTVVSRQGGTGIYNRFHYSGQTNTPEDAMADFTKEITRAVLERSQHDLLVELEKSDGFSSQVVERFYKGNV